MKPYLVIITGLSGSGKSTALNALEDVGFYCVDNLPVLLIHQFLNLIERASDKIDKTGMVVDVREKVFLHDFQKVVNELKTQGYDLRIIFLDVRDEVIIKRFKETRRKHPLFPLTLLEAIKKERTILEPIKRIADEIVDTSDFTPHQLRSRMVALVERKDRIPETLIMSFGYKFGIPVDADIIFDVRFLPNPYFVESLKEKNGRNEEVREFVLKKKKVKEFLKRMQDFVEYVLEQYKGEGKTEIVIGIGCTGGRHRSVVMAEELGKKLRKRKYVVRTFHRDIDKES